MKRFTLTIVAVWLGLLAPGSMFGVPGRATRPNFIVILADDLGYGDLGCFGNQVNRTPHLDQLAREGVRLTDFHSNGANCSPTRAALLTGRYQQRMRIEGALGENAPGLLKSEITLAERLREAGYATGIFGKWHLGYKPDNGPLQHGFDEFTGHLHGATDYLSHVDKYGRLDWWHGDKPVVEEGHNTELITRHSIDFIERHRERPFFLFVSHSAIHFPWMNAEDKAHREVGKRYEDKIGKLGPHADGPVQPVVRRMIEKLDESVGRIVSAVKRAKLERNTLVFFTSDNGGIVREAGVPIKPENVISINAPLRGQKHGLYEGGHRVPAIAWWPGVVPAGIESTTTTMTMDLFPTLLELAGLNRPAADTPVRLDGVSFAPVLLRNEALPERTLFWRQGDSRAVRSGNWKLVSIHDAPFELYDLASDIGERKNLAKDQPDKLRELVGRHREWAQSLSDGVGR